MAVLITREEGLSTPLDDDEVRAVCAHVLEAEGVRGDVELSFSWVSDEPMRELNRTWRSIDAPTDVLSFSCDDPFDEDACEGMPVELGDIVIDPLQIARQAPDFGNDAAAECRLMLVHGMLHLLGYDHIEDDEALRMERREEELLRALALLRGDDPDEVRVGPTTRHVDD